MLSVTIEDVLVPSVSWVNNLLSAARLVPPPGGIPPAPPSEEAAAVLAALLELPLNLSEASHY